MPTSLTVLIRLAAIALIALTSWDAATAQAYSPPPPVPSPPSNPVPRGVSIELTLSEAIAIGLRDNRNIQSAYLQRVLQKFSLEIAERQFIPVARITAQANHGKADSATDTTTSSIGASANWLLPTGGVISFSWAQRDNLESDTTDRARTASLSISQPLLRGAGLDVNLAPLRMARMRERMNRLALDQTVSGIVTSIIYSYRSLLQAQQQIELAERSLNRTKLLLETNRALIDAGRMAAADIVQTESQVASQEVAVIQAQRSLENAQLTLSRLLGIDPRSNLLAIDKIEAEPVAIDFEQVRNLAFDSRMDIIGQRIAVDEARQALRIAKNNRLWDLSVDASLTRTEDVDPILGRLAPQTSSTVGISLSIPIGDYGAQYGELSAETGVKLAELRYDDLTEAVEAQVRDAVQTVDMSWRQLETVRRARTLTQRAFELEQEKLKAGRSSNFQLLSFQDNLRDADNQELAASIAYLNALTALDQQIGNTLETWRIHLND